MDRATARVNRVIRHEGREYVLRRGEPVEAPVELLEALRRAGYVEPAGEPAKAPAGGKRKEG